MANKTLAEHEKDLEGLKASLTEAQARLPESMPEIPRIITRIHDKESFIRHLRSKAQG